MRNVSLTYLGKEYFRKAKSELKQLEVLARDQRLKEMAIWKVNSMHSIVDIARKVLKAEMPASEGKFDQSIALINEAVSLEDGLNFREPPDWFFSVRHNLGAVQIEAGKYTDAVNSFEEDLQIYPKNGWAQHGIKLAYQKMNDRENVKLMEAHLKESWATADIIIESSRIK